MTSRPVPICSSSKSAFTLVELLVVVAIIAAIGSGISVYYGAELVADSLDQLTLHEMHEIKQAFLQFYNDNYLRLQREMNDHGGDGDLPSAIFRSQFNGDHVLNDLFDGRMEFFETYGLWFLFQRTVPGVPFNSSPLNDYDEFPTFEPFDPVSGQGWNGPYIDVNSGEAWTFSGIDFPQIADKHGIGAVNAAGNPLSVYRVLYYEHCEDFSDSSEPIYRRLLLVASRGISNRDELTSDELLLETGNRRGGNTGDNNGRGRLNSSTGAFANEGASGPYILELLNMDQFRS